MGIALKQFDSYLQNSTCGALWIPTVAFTEGVWPRSVRGQSPNANGRSELVATTHEALDNDTRVGRVRRELFDNVTFQFGVWAEEHSAQLDSKENRRLQDLFSIGARNILRN
jgi:DEAD/DEAH box helicase domain-containing protein